MATPQVVVFDVNETLSDMAPMAGRFTDVGLDAAMAKVWFASLLRDGFAHAAAGDSAEFAVTGAEALKVLMASSPPSGSQDDAVQHVLEGLRSLSLHPDVADSVRAMRQAGLRLVTLTNGAVASSEQLLGAAGIRDEFEMLLSVDDAGAWKPARAAYEYAASRCGTDLSAMVLVAVHPWDVHGAVRAGMSAAWIDRGGAHYPAHFEAPTWTASSLTELASTLTA